MKEAYMKNLLIMTALSLTIIPSINLKAAISLPFKQFIGTYELVNAAKETEATMGQRASKCRDVLYVFEDEKETILHLRGEDNNGIGLTLNWLENETSESIKNEISEGAITQKRLWDDRRVLGVHRTIDLVTSIKKEGDTLTYNYKREIYNGLLDRTSSDSEVLCIYKKIK